MKKPIVILADTNPAQISLSNDITNAQKISLVYFRLVNYVAPVGLLPIKPINIFIKIDQGSNLRSDIVVPSNNIPQINGTFQRLSSAIVPVHTETVSHTRFSGNDYDYLAIWGKQPKGMRWQTTEVSNFNNFQITVYDQNMQPLRFERATTYPAYIQLVFEVEWSDKINQSKLWKVDPVFMNNMNS